MGSKNVQTIADIARLTGFSQSTVSRALNDSPLISPATRERIQSVAREHNFQANISASRLRLQHSRTIGVVIQAFHPGSSFTITDLFLLEMLGGISSTLTALNYDLLIVSIDPQDADWPRKYFDTGRVDGFILLTSTNRQTHIKRLIKMKIPFIVWFMPAASNECCYVSNDNFNGGKLAVEHLLQKGRRRIAFLGGPKDETETKQRYEGYEAAIVENGLTIDPVLINYGDWTHDSGVEQMRKLLDSGIEFDAVFANSDLMASGAINVLHEHGLRIPQDVSVVGYDDLSIAKNINPALTTISQKIPLVGNLIAQNLIQNIETGLVTNLIVPAELIERQST